MTRRMLINAQNREELRIAIVSGSVLQDFQVEVAERGLNRGNVYRGYINNIQPSLNAAFVNFGAERDGFLSMQDLVPEAWHRQPKEGKRPRIEEVLERGKPVLVQVTRDPEGQKGAAVTASVSLAGRYLVFTPFDDTRGVSRKVEDEELRAKLKDQTSTLKVPEGGGFIVRTNAADQNKTALTKDFAVLAKAWKQIQTDFKKGQGPQLLYNDQVIITRALRDYLDPSIEEVLIDDDAAFEEAQTYARQFMARGKVKILRYADREPLFTRFRVDEQIDRIHDRTVKLPGGGAIVIDRTEALIAIDVNSAKATRSATQEENAYKVNIEAAREVARQLRLRDIGGLVVVDFIDMRAGKHRQLVEKTLREAMKDDKARFDVGRISPNGLLEINRQRLQQALHLRTHRPCPTCSGTGRIASPEVVGLNLLRKIEARAATSPIQGVRIALHPELADAFQNTRRREIARMELEFDIHIEVIASNKLHRPEQEIEWIAREGVPQLAAAKSHPHPHPQPHAPEREKPAAAVAAAPPAAEGEGGRKKKRRRKKKRGDQNGHGDPTQPQLPIVGQSAHTDDEDDDEQPNLMEVEDHEDGDEHEEHEDGAFADSGVAALPAAEGNGERKKKRRRRRGRRGGAPIEVTPIADAMAELPETDGPPVSFWVMDDSAAPTVEQAAPYSVTSDADDELPLGDEELTDEQALDAPAPAPSDHAGRKRRRRRRRGPRHDAASEPATLDAVQQGATATASSDDDDEPEQLELSGTPTAVDVERSEASETPARTRRPRRSRSKARKPADTLIDVPLADVFVAEPEPEPEQFETVSETKPRPKRRPRATKPKAEPAAKAKTATKVEASAPAELTPGSLSDRPRRRSRKKTE